MSLIKKISNYINFSSKRNFAEEKEVEKIPEKDMNKNVVDRQEAEIADLTAKLAEAKGEKTEEVAKAEEPKSEETKVEETKVEETPKETKEETTEVAEAETKAEPVAVENPKNEEQVKEDEDPDEFDKIAGTNVDSEEEEKSSEESSESSEPEAKEEAKSEEKTETAEKTEEKSDKESDEAKKELKEESEVPEVKDYDGAKVADANGKTHTIVKRADGYYIKGTTSKVLDAEGNPTSKYRTLGNALKNGQSVNDYVKSKGGWAKYNKELKSNACKA